MNNLVTSEQLYQYLVQLKSTIQGFDYSKLNNVTFFNIKSLYDFMSKLPCGESTVQDILDNIDGYIPLAITMESMDLFIESAAEIDYDKKNSLLNAFSCRCRVDFMNLIKNTTSDENWNKIVNSCQELRKQKILCEDSYY